MAVDNDTLLVLTGPSMALYTNAGGTDLAPMPELGQVAALDGDADGGVWIGLAGAPGATLLYNGAVTDYFELTSAALDTPTARAHIPRAIASADGGVVVLSRALNLLRIDD